MDENAKKELQRLMKDVFDCANYEWIGDSVHITEYMSPARVKKVATLAGLDTTDWNVEE